jgi:NarL family two-component system response regulator YdfI
LDDGRLAHGRNQRRREGPVTRVWVVAGPAVRRADLETVVAGDRAVEVVGRSASLASAVRDIADAQPDVIVIQLDTFDVRELAGLQATISGHAGFPFPAVVALANPRGMAGVARAVESGIRALLPLDASAAEIGGAIAAAVAGLVVLHPAFLEGMADVAPALRQPDATPATPLTERELEVLALMAQGLANKEIAGSLGISEHTVKFHIGSIFNKLDVSSRTEAVAEGIRAGLVLL